MERIVAVAEQSQTVCKGGVSITANCTCIFTWGRCDLCRSVTAYYRLFVTVLNAWLLAEQTAIRQTIWTWNNLPRNITAGDCAVFVWHAYKCLAKLRFKPINNSVFFLSVFTSIFCKHRQKEHSVWKSALVV